VDEVRFASILSNLVAALDQPPSERVAFLRSRIGDDEEMFTLASHLLPSGEAMAPRETSGDWPGLSSAEDSSFGSPLSAIARLAASIVPGEQFPERIGRYSLRWRLGRGGMGDVYLAEIDRSSGEPSDPLPFSPAGVGTVSLVALKLLRPGSYSDDGFARFRREAEILARLDHPGIARIYDSGMSTVGGRNYPFIALEYVDGVTLREWSRSRGPSAEDCVRLFREICRAVEHAHDAGVVHRDLKPENIMIDREGRPHVLDFGVARLRREEQKSASHTETSAVLGTPAYMSPEQLRREHDRVDARSDVFTLGVIGYELLTRAHPFAVGRGLAAIQAADVLAREPRPVTRKDPSLHRDLDAIFGRALEKTSAHRFASAGEMADDLERHLRGKRLGLRTLSPLRRARRWARRHPTTFRSSVAVTVVALIAAVAVAARTSAPPSLDPQAVYTKASADIDEADRLIFIAEWTDQNKLDAMKLLHGARSAIAKAPERSYTPHYYAHIYRRLAEASIHIYGPKCDRSGLEAARGYLLQAAKTDWTPDGLDTLSETSPLYKKLRENSRHAPVSLLRMVTTDLAELGEPVGMLSQATGYSEQALAIWNRLGADNYGSPEVGYGVTGYDKALLLGGGLGEQFADSAGSCRSRRCTMSASPISRRPTPCTRSSGGQTRIHRFWRAMASHISNEQKCREMSPTSIRRGHSSTVSSRFEPRREAGRGMHRPCRRAHVRGSHRAAWPTLGPNAEICWNEPSGISTRHGAPSHPSNGRLTAPRWIYRRRRFMMTSRY